jgi:hypothetical protein
LINKIKEENRPKALPIFTSYMQKENFINKLKRNEFLNHYQTLSDKPFKLIYKGLEKQDAYDLYS